MFFFIAFISACFGVVWVSILTHYTGLLSFLPKYYPRFLQYVLQCESCLAGWSSCVTMTVLNEWILLIPCMLVSMVFAHTIREKGGFQ